MEYQFGREYCEQKSLESRLNYKKSETAIHIPAEIYLSVMNKKVPAERDYSNHH
jgi:hypothetical protein